MKIFPFIIICGNLMLNINSSHSSFNEAFFRKSILRPEVCAESGCVRGKYESGRLKLYEAFYGIPYAEPPVGKLRLENPVPYHGWSGYWDASYPRDDCFQKNYYLPGSPLSGSENCLYLNVYRPSTWSADEKFPVLVYIHGGSYISFSGNPKYFGPEYIMDNGEVFLVTLNYRLGFLGFLCSEDGAVKGNFGLKDQQLALQWVARNIASFGGDANSITVAGQSVGAVSANLHMLNPKSQAFFHRAILMSGNAIAPWVYPIDFASQFRNAAKNVGLKDWDTASSYKLARQLKTVDALKLVEAVGQTFAFYATPPVPVRPCIEGDWEGAFLTEDPRLVWAEGRFVQKPILIGLTKDEGIIESEIIVNKTLLQQFNENIFDLLPIHIDFPRRYVFDVLRYYFGDKDYIDDTNFQQYFKMFKDRMFNYPLYTFVNQYLKYADVQENPIFMYEHGFESSYTFLKYTTGTDVNFGVSHIDDLFYLFTMTSLFPIFDANSPEGKMSDIYVRTMVNFVARGEVKVWRTFNPCTALTSTPFCDRQIFKRYTDLDPNQVIVSVSNEIELEMIKLWSQIDNGVKAINLPRCT